MECRHSTFTSRNLQEKTARLRPWPSCILALTLVAATATFPVYCHAAANHLVKQARVLVERGRFSAAVALLLNAVREEPGSAEPHRLLGRTLRDAGYLYLDNTILGRALDEYHACLAVEPDDFPSGMGGAVLLYEGSRFREALEIFEGLRQRPDAPPELASYLSACRWHIHREEPAQEGSAAKDNGRCRFCWRPLQGEVWDLGDGQLVCDECYSKGLRDDAGLRDIVGEVTAALAGLGLTGRAVTGSHLVSAEEMRTLAGQHLDSFSGVSPKDLAGLFAPTGEEWHAYILRGLPPSEVVKVVAHELTHAWVREHCPPDIPLGSNEGFAEWVAYQVLLDTSHAETARLMFLDTSLYGIHFKRLEVLGRIHGTAGLIQRMKDGVP